MTTQCPLKCKVFINRSSFEHCMKARREDAGTLKLDDLDIDILRSLNANARKSFRDIAKELQISLTTVSNRVKAMEKNGVIQGYIPVIDPEKLGYDIMGVIGIKVIHGRIVETERDLAKEPGVFAVFDSTGDRKSTRLNSSHGYISDAV